MIVVFVMIMVLIRGQGEACGHHDRAVNGPNIFVAIFEDDSLAFRMCALDGLADPC